MRIAVVSTSFPQHPSDPSGHFVLAHCQELLAKAHDVHVIVPRAIVSAATARRWLPPGLTVLEASHATLFGWPGAVSRVREKPLRAVGIAAFVLHAAALLRGLSPERVYAHWLVPSLFPVSVACQCEIHGIAHGADIRFLAALPPSLRRHVLRSISDRASSVQCVSESLQRDLKSISEPDQWQSFLPKLSVAPMPIAVSVDPDERTRLRALIPEDRVLVVFVGRLVPDKRVELLIDAIRFLPIRAQVVVVGDGPELVRLRALSQGLDVSFVGALPRNECLVWIAAADVVVHPSRSEGAPTVVREARQLGIPVVACDAGDVRRWALLDNGITLSEPCAEELSRAILRALGPSRCA